MKKKRLLYSILAVSSILSLASCSIVNGLQDYLNPTTSSSSNNRANSNTTKTTTTSVETTTISNPIETTTDNVTTTIETTTDNVTTSSNTTTEVVSTTESIDESNFTMVQLNVSNIVENKALKNPILNTYYYQDSIIPYVSLNDFINVMDGYITASSVKVTKNGNLYTYTKTTSDDEVVTITINPSTNEITLNNFPTYIDALGNTNTYNITDKMVKATKEYIQSPETQVINLSNYNMEIFEIDGMAILPEAVANILFASPLYYNLYYTGSGYVFDSSVATTQEKALFSNVTLDESIELRQYSYDTLALIIDNFFGLNNYKGITSAYGILEKYKDSLLSLSSTTNIEATLNVLYYELDDGHTGVSSYSYNSSSNKDYKYNTNVNRSNISSTYNELYTYYEASQTSSFNPFNRKTSSLYKASGDTALVSLDSFELTGDSSSQTTDTFYMLTNALEAIGDNYSNIVINLGLNGGGSIASMIETIGLLTDEDIVIYTYNEHTKALIKYTYQVDCDLDGDFTDNDSYASSYDFYVLSSGYTYSAANEFVNLCNEYGYAKVLGQTSGGGACVVLPTMLPDGTSFQTSGSISLANYDKENNVLEIIDGGITVTNNISYKYFYNASYLNSYIASL